MKRFPLTRKATLTGNGFSSSYDTVKMKIKLTDKKSYRRIHIPDYCELLEGSITLHGDIGTYVISLPKECITVKKETAHDMKVDIRPMLSRGRHTIYVEVAKGMTFHALLEVTIRRSVVDVNEKGYILKNEDLKYYSRHILEDDRNVHRIGRFSLFLKSKPWDFKTAESKSSISLNGIWKIKRVPEGDISDYSTLYTDDSQWDETFIPHELKMEDDKNIIWLRKKIFIPEDINANNLFIRFESIDDQAQVFVNSELAGYNLGWHRPFQFDVSDLVKPGEENIIVVRFKPRKEESIFHDGGVTYTFIKDYALTKYPLKKHKFCGVIGKLNEITSLENKGAVKFSPRFHPYPEECVSMSFSVNENPVCMYDQSIYKYTPPVFEYENIQTKNGVRMSIRAMVLYDIDGVVFKGKTTSQDPVSINLSIEWPGKDKGFFLDSNKKGITIKNNDTLNYLKLYALEGKTGNITTSGNNGSVTVTPTVDGDFAFIALFGSNNCKNKLLSEPESIFNVSYQKWEKNIYSIAMPCRLSLEQQALMRATKQILTLDSKNIPGEISGILTDLIKYPVFWLRDLAISTPGSLYAGMISRETAIKSVSEVYSKARENIDYTILYPDGFMTPMQTASDSSQLAVFAIYETFVQAGDKLLDDVYETVKVYIDYMIKTETMFDNDIDGIVRASDGDWWDYACKGKYEREGAVPFVTIAYLRALKYANIMAEAVGDMENAEKWKEIYNSGIAMMVKKIEDGGFLIEEKNYLASSIQTYTDNHPNGWKYPDDLDKVTVCEGFRPLPHSMAFSENMIKDIDIIKAILESLDLFNTVRPLPGLTQFPWSDFFKEEGFDSQEYEETFFKDKWKSLPGNQATGGRWTMVGGIIMKGLWKLASMLDSKGNEEEKLEKKALELANEAWNNMAGFITNSRHPGLVYEDIHSSGLFRNEAGDPRDTEGFFYNWGSATYLEAIVEGKFGISPEPNGVTIDITNCEIDDGIMNVPFSRGFISYQRMEDKKYVFNADCNDNANISISIPERYEQYQCKCPEIDCIIEDSTGGKSISISLKEGKKSFKIIFE